jgi:hypothetical protein
MIWFFFWGACKKKGSSMKSPITGVRMSMALIGAVAISWINRKTCYLPLILVLTVVSIHLVQAQVVFTIPSEFLGEYPPLKPIENMADSYIWRAPDVQKKYRAVLIEQPEIFLAPDSEYKGIKPDAVKMISDMLLNFIATAEAEVRPVVENPGPAVVRLRPALMDLYFKKGSGAFSWFRNVGGIVDYEMRAAIGRNISLVKARLELEATDSETGKRLVVLVFQSSQNKIERSEGPSFWSNLIRKLDLLSEVVQAQVADLFVDEPRTHISQ